jgi:hypothetical protein
MRAAWSRLSEGVFEVIEQSPARLWEIEGIGEKRAKKITTGWADQKIVWEIMVFLHAHGVSTSRAVRIFKTYGQEAIAIVFENPYRFGARHSRHRLFVSVYHRSENRHHQGFPPGPGSTLTRPFSGWNRN